MRVLRELNASVTRISAFSTVGTDPSANVAIPMDAIGFVREVCGDKIIVDFGVSLNQSKVLAPQDFEFVEVVPNSVHGLALFHSFYVHGYISASLYLSASFCLSVSPLSLCSTMFPLMPLSISPCLSLFRNLPLVVLVDNFACSAGSRLIRRFN